jgi:CheY-like chemotaxis protein
VDAQTGQNAGNVLEKESGRDEQVRQEVNAFRENASAETAEVGTIFLRVAELISPLLSQRGIALEIEQPPIEMVTAVNPTALRQILVRGVLVLSREMSTGAIRLGVEISPDGIVITIQASPVQEQELEGDSLIQELIGSYRGSWSLERGDNRVICRVVLPSTGSITVLVVDDNADLIYTYQRYVQGTPYRLFSTHDGSRLFETIRTVAPDIVILDVMMPDIDGWELLSRLHEHPETHHLPVILSTVVEEEELAHALGAAGYLAKPVRYHEFMRALDDASVRLKQERR